MILKLMYRGDTTEKIRALWASESLKFEVHLDKSTGTEFKTSSKLLSFIIYSTGDCNDADSAFALCRFSVYIYSPPQSNYICVFYTISLIYVLKCWAHSSDKWQHLLSL